MRVEAGKEMNWETKGIGKGKKKQQVRVQEGGQLFWPKVLKYLTEYCTFNI